MFVVQHILAKYQLIFDSSYTQLPNFEIVISILYSNTSEAANGRFLQKRDFDTDAFRVNFTKIFRATIKHLRVTDSDTSANL